MLEKTEKSRQDFVSQQASRCNKQQIPPPSSSNRATDVSTGLEQHTHPLIYYNAFKYRCFSSFYNNTPHYMKMCSSWFRILPRQSSARRRSSAPSPHTLCPPPLQQCGSSMAEVQAEKTQRWRFASANTTHTNK